MPDGDWLSESEDTLGRVKALLTSRGIKYQIIPNASFGVGVGVAWSETGFLMVTVPAPPNSDQIYLTCGVLKNITHDRLAALECCNNLTSENAAFPFYLHDADIGWDILLQQSYPFRLMEDVPPFFESCVSHLHEVAERALSTFSSASLGGTPYLWNLEDLQRLLQVSLI